MEEEFVPLTPVNFFQISADCHYWPPTEAKGRASKERYRLPDTSALCSEETFAEVYLGWNEEGLRCVCAVREPIRHIAYPALTEGDSIELFIDTRDVKSGGFNTRFCHHFYLLPEPLEGVQAGEITHFRTEDSHPLCNPADLVVKVKKSSSGYEAELFIPAHCLMGYDPSQFKRLGFAYRINRSNQPAQHFTVVSDDFQIDQNPGSWSSLILQQVKV